MRDRLPNYRWVLGGIFLLSIASPGYTFSSIVPKKGQNNEQQTFDIRECNAMARERTGFDPTRSPRDRSDANERQQRRQKIDAYNQVLQSCLQERGYTVR
jgi:hypothetical protein